MAGKDGETQDDFVARKIAESRAWEMQRQLDDQFYETGLPESEKENWLKMAQTKPLETVRTQNIPKLEQSNNTKKSVSYWSKENLKDRYQKYKRVGRVVAPKLAHGAITGARTFAKGSMAIGGAMAGGAITLATTGDLGKTVQASAAGAATGSAIVSTGIGISSGAYSLSSEVMDSVREVQDAWYGNDAKHKEEKKAQQLKDFKKNSELENALSKAFGEDVMKKMMETGGEVDTYYGYGARESDDIIAMHKTKETITGVSDNEAAEITGGFFQLNREYGTIKDRKKREEAIGHEISNKEKNENKAKNLTRFAMNGLDTLQDFKSHRR